MRWLFFCSHLISPFFHSSSSCIGDAVCDKTIMPPHTAMLFVHSGIGSKNRNDNSIQHLMAMKEKRNTSSGKKEERQRATQTKRFSPRHNSQCSTQRMNESDKMFFACLDWFVRIVDSLCVCTFVVLRRGGHLEAIQPNSRFMLCVLMCSRFGVIVSQITRIHFLVNTQLYFLLNYYDYYDCVLSELNFPQVPNERGGNGADGVVVITHSTKLNVCNFAAAMWSVESLNVMANIFGVKYTINRMMRGRACKMT